MNLSTWKNPRRIQRVNSNIYALPIIVRNSANEISAVTHVDMFTHMHPLTSYRLLFTCITKDMKDLSKVQ